MVEPVSVSHFCMIFERFTVASAPCCTAPCTSRPRDARHSMLRAVGRAHHIQDHVHVAKLGGEILFAMVDGSRGAELLAGTALLRAARSGEDRSAKRMRQLDRSSSDSAG